MKFYFKRAAGVLLAQGKEQGRGIYYIVNYYNGNVGGGCLRSAHICK